ncbi:MAG: hypothetical protein IT372_39595 [Polyangiaceae bacterium]|nr:hypothetical protein [Polyangiaceae bacterium]
MKTVLALNLAATLVCGALIALTYGPPLEIFLEPSLYTAGLIGMVLLCGAAMLGHRDARADGGHVRLTWADVFRPAPVWAWVLFGVSVACLLVFAFQLPETTAGGSKGFKMTRAALEGRPDRWRFMISFFLFFHSLGAATAISAIRRRDAWMNVP